MRAAAPLQDRPMVGGLAEVGRLYEQSADQVHRLVRHEVRAPQPLIEDACQVAWSRLVSQRERVGRDTAVAWLVTTAMREAFKLLRRADRELSLDGLLDERIDLGEPVARSTPAEIVECRARLEALRTLSQRQRQLVWLQGVGLSYAEMADEIGATPRTVERQLRRARHKLTVAEAASAVSRVQVDLTDSGLSE